MRSSLAAVLVASIVASWSLSASAQSKPGIASRVFKLLGSFAGAVAVDTATEVSKEYLIDWMKIAQPQPPTTQPSDLRSREFGYRFTLQWTDPRDATVTYSGTLTMLGATGNFHVTMFYSSRPVARVEQFMSARPASGRAGDVELFPTSAVMKESASPDITYAPDTFWLTQLPGGEWTIKDTCDGRACAPVFAMTAELLASDR